MAACDTAAFLCNNFGLAYGPVSMVTMLASLFSAVTVLLAAIFSANACNAPNGWASR